MKLKFKNGKAVSCGFVATLAALFAMSVSAPCANAVAIGYDSDWAEAYAAPVAIQAGGYTAQLNSYNQAFRNMDMYMLMPSAKRKAAKKAAGSAVYSTVKSVTDNAVLWTSPDATFENIHLQSGPRVSNVSYSEYVGGESEVIEFGNGWDGIWGVYAGYNGSHQAYDGESIYQNGGTFGVVGMAYKGNFFGGLTVNGGASDGFSFTKVNYDEMENFSRDNFTTVMGGVAAKTGYNFELADGKFVIQPNYMMSYSIVNLLNHTHPSGIKINTNALNVIHVEPGVKFIGNLNNGWQPYAGVSMVYNMSDGAKQTIQDVSFARLHIKPYVKYGVGIRKTWGERFSGFFQAYAMNGGRNGVGLQGCFALALGK